MNVSLDDWIAAQPLEVQAEIVVLMTAYERAGKPHGPTAGDAVNWGEAQGYIKHGRMVRLP